MTINIQKIKPPLTIEYDYFIDDVKTGRTYLYLDDIRAMFNQGGSLKFIISHCNHPIPDIKTCFYNREDFVVWLNQLKALHH